MSANNSELLRRIEAIVGAAGILSGNGLAGRSAGIWSGKALQALALVRPKTTAEVSRVMRLCHAAGQVVVVAGGMTGLAYCVRHPGATRSFVSISSATRAEPFSIAVRSLQREMIRSDPKWDNGNYDPEDPPIVGQRLARKLGMITYRSGQEWRGRFGRERATDEGGTGDRFKIEFSVESYPDYHAQKFTGDFDPNCYLYLSHASDLFDLAEYGGSLAAGFKKLRLESTLVVGVTTDILFPIHQQRELASGFANVVDDAELIELDCIRGHDSFLVEMDAFRPIICDFFDSHCPDSRR